MYLSVWLIARIIVYRDIITDLEVKLKSLDEFVHANGHWVTNISLRFSLGASPVTIFFWKKSSSPEIFIHIFVFNNCVQVVERHIRNYSSMIVRLSPYEKIKSVQQPLYGARKINVTEVKQQNQ